MVRYGEYFDAAAGDDDGVLPLCRKRMVFGHDCPAVGQFFDVRLAGIDHRFNREDHALFELEAGARFTVMEHLGIFVEVLADAMATEFPNHGVAVFLRVRLDGMADIAERRAGSDCIDTFPEALKGDVAETLGQGRNLANGKHPARVAIPAILNHRDVQIDDIALFELLVAGNAMADLVIDRGADRFGVGRVARWLVVEGCRDRPLYVDHVVVTEAVELTGRDAGFDERRNVINDFGCQSASDTHFLDLVGVFKSDAHGFCIF